MKAFLSQSRSAEYTPFYDGEHNLIGGYKWTQYYTAVEIYIEQDNCKKGCLCFYVTPRPYENEQGYITSASQYVIYLPALDWFVEILKSENTDWNALFKTIPKTGSLIRNSVDKDRGYPFLSEAGDVTCEYEGRFLVLGIYIDSSYPAENEVELDGSDESTDQRIDRLLEAVDAIQEELENFDHNFGKTNWKSIFWSVGKVALAAFIGAEILDFLDMDLDFSGDDSSCNFLPDISDSDVPESTISFCGKVDDDISYYERMVNISSGSEQAHYMEKLRNLLKKAGKL